MDWNLVATHTIAAIWASRQVSSGLLTHNSMLTWTSVYCIESCRSSAGPQYVITGSRDRTMKFWNLDTGKCLGTFGSGVVGGELEGHRGSVLCIKFVWEVEGEKGLVFSGSSDSTVCIWDLWLIKNTEGDVELRTKVHAVLRGHGGGVLDLEVVDGWIITWCASLHFSLSTQWD